MNITFTKMNGEHILLWEKWIQVPHVKDIWFIEGYETTDYIFDKIKGNGHTHPFIIYLNNTPIGYIQYCDLYAYRTICPKPKGIWLQLHKRSKTVIEINRSLKSVFS